MLKSVPNFVARTATALAANATVVEINASAADLLREKLQAGDWLYASIDDTVSYEVVRVTGVTGSVIAIDRNVEDTGAYDFLSNAKLTYILGTMATQDVVAAVLAEGVNFTGTGAAKVTQTGTFSWNIDVPRVNIASDDPSIQVVDMYPTFFLIKK